MKKLLLLMAAVLLLAACGVSTKDKNEMETALQVKLLDAYLKSDVSCMFLNASIKDVIEDNGFTDNTKYKASFVMEFESHDQPIRMYGDAYFDKGHNIVDMPSDYGDNIIGIYISFGTRNTTEQIDTQTDSLVLPIFLNHNTYER